MHIANLRRGRRLAGAALTAALAATPVGARAQARPPATPQEMVAAYDALADTILGANKTEEKLVHAILAATYAHAQAELARARQALKAERRRGRQGRRREPRRGRGPDRHRRRQRRGRHPQAAARGRPSRQLRGRGPGHLRRGLRRRDQGGQEGLPRLVAGHRHAGRASRRRTRSTRSGRRSRRPGPSTSPPRE